MRRPRVLGPMAAALLSACASGVDEAQVAELPVLSLDEPVLEIGVLEGDDDLVFAAIERVIRLPGGEIAVSDGGATRISLFDAHGGFVRSWGSEGEGPGEFRSLSRIYPLGPDSLMAAERHSGRLTVFDLEGGLGRLEPGSQMSGDTTFTLDSWLSGRFWVEGALTRDERIRAKTILQRLSVPAEAPGYRFAHWTDDGDLWVREPADGSGTNRWTRVTEDGPDAVIRMPAPFRPTHIATDDVLGVWSDESGVNFVRSYRPVPTGETVPAPAWLSSPPSRSEPTGAPGDEARITEQELMNEIRSSVKNLARAQEIHYAGHMTYTSAIDSLERFEQPQSMEIDILRGDPRGWIAVFTHPDVDRVCGLAYGFGTPPGWTPGAILCGPDPELTATPTGSR